MASLDSDYSSSRARLHAVDDDIAALFDEISARDDCDLTVPERRLSLQERMRAEIEATARAEGQFKETSAKPYRPSGRQCEETLRKSLAFERQDTLASEAGSLGGTQTPSDNPDHTLTVHERTLPDELPSSRHERKRLPAWELCDERSRAYFLHRSVNEAQGYAFTLDLSIPNELLILNSGATRLRKKLWDAFKKVLGCCPPFWFCPDTTPGELGRIHIQGGIIIPAEQIPLAHKALQAAGGWRHENASWIDVRSNSWADYCTRNLSQIDAPGSKLVASQELNRRARELHKRVKALSDAYSPRNQHCRKSKLTTGNQMEHRPSSTAVEDLPVDENPASSLSVI